MPYPRETQFEKETDRSKIVLLQVCGDGKIVSFVTLQHTVCNTKAPHGLHTRVVMIHETFHEENTQNRTSPRRRRVVQPVLRSLAQHVSPSGQTGRPHRFVPIARNRRRSVLLQTRDSPASLVWCQRASVDRSRSMPFRNVSEPVLVC